MTSIMERIAEAETRADAILEEANRTARELVAKTRTEAEESIAAAIESQRTHSAEMLYQAQTDGEAIAAKMRELGEKRRDKQPLDLPSAGSAFKRPEGHFAAKLIEDCGLKGFRVGGAQVSEKHAGFVVNRGGATSHEVYELLDTVRRVVYEKTGVTLEPEIVVLPPDYCPEDTGPQVPRHRVTVREMKNEK